jgi:polysaccharide biosynthesis/export protein
LSNEGKTLMQRSYQPKFRMNKLTARMLPLLLSLSAFAFPQAQATSNSNAPANTPAKPTAVPADPDFIIGADDVLAIDVWKEAEVSRAVTVRSDGKISLPLVGELPAAGKTPRQLQEDIRVKLAGFIADPEVTLVVQEIRSHHFNVLGQVQHPGSFVLTSSTTVLDAIAQAGGFRDFAKQKNIYILRSNPDGSQVRLPVNYREVIKGDARQNIKLTNHDTVVVP